MHNQRSQQTNLELGCGVEHDVLGLVLNVLSPTGQPRDRVVIANVLPLVAGRRSNDHTPVS